MYIFIYYTLLYIHTVWVCLKNPHLPHVICNYIYIKPTEAIRATCHWTLDLRFAYLPWCPLAKKPSPGSVWLVVWLGLVGWIWMEISQSTNLLWSGWTWNLGVCGSLILRPGNLWRSHWERNFVETVQSCKAEYLQGHFEDVTLRLTSTHWIYMHKMVSMICSPEVTCCNVGLSNADGSRSHSRTSPANSQSKTSIHPPQFNRWWSMIPWQRFSRG